VQVLLGYAFDRERDAADVDTRLGRVADHYGRLWPATVERRGAGSGRVGLHIWAAAESAWTWPSWQQDGVLAVATLHAPLGYERVLGDVAPERSAIALARALHADPWKLLEIAPPFVLASLEPARDRIRFFTDGIGLGRLFELRFPGGWVWSNRPAATCLFAGVRAEPDRDGWRIHAATGWFMGDRSPFAGVFAVPGGTAIGYDASGLGRTESMVDCLAAWCSPRGYDATAPAHVDQVVDAMRAFFDSLGRMSRARFVADLSGGRDSRLVVAAALASGLELSVHTNGDQPGEAEIAERLIAALPPAIAKRVTHVVRSSAGHEGFEPPILANALAWHRYQEGLRPASYLFSPAPDASRPANYVGMSGAAGEIAHGHYYPPDYADIGRLPRTERLDRFTDELCRKAVRSGGIPAVAHAMARQMIRRRLEDAYIHGLEDASMLDHFYATERLRKWSIAGEKTNRLVPLLTPEFIRAAFDLTPDQRRDNALHTAVTDRLIPEWKDVPYYRRPKTAVRPARRSRLGHAADREVISAIVSSPAEWEDAFEPAAVERSWRDLLADRGGARDEELIQRVCWRATFTHYLNELAGDGLEPERPGNDVVFVRRRRRRGRMRRYAARGLRGAARTIEPGA